MSKPRVLMLSSSRAGNEDYLESAIPHIGKFLDGVTEVIFVPFAGVTLSWDYYTEKVQQALPQLTITGIHQTPDPTEAIRKTQAILVGGGNTFNLLNELQIRGLDIEIQQAIDDGCGYIGWSAGSNICGLSIKTTNDMPIVEPKSFNALNFVPFQLNPHYTDYQPEGFNGETRDQRIAEFGVLNPSTPVVGIREGSALLLANNQLSLLGEHDAVIFLGNSKTKVRDTQTLTALLS
ncbi:dipeptidase PepE [Aliiglaciecola sp.]|nr:dipeptidase PepE [Aliiglaciecola sp.]